MNTIQAIQVNTSPTSHPHTQMCRTAQPRAPMHIVHARPPAPSRVALHITMPPYVWCPLCLLQQRVYHQLRVNPHMSCLPQTLVTTTLIPRHHSRARTPPSQPRSYSVIAAVLPVITDVLAPRHHIHVHTLPSQPHSHLVIAYTPSHPSLQPCSLPVIADSLPAIAATLAPCHRSRAHTPPSRPCLYSAIAAALAPRHHRHARALPSQSCSRPAITATLAPGHRTHHCIPPLPRGAQQPHTSSFNAQLCAHIRILEVR